MNTTAWKKLANVFLALTVLAYGILIITAISEGIPLFLVLTISNIGSGMIGGAGTSSISFVIALLISKRNLFLLGFLICKLFDHLCKKNDSAQNASATQNAATAQSTTTADSTKTSAAAADTTTASGANTASSAYRTTGSASTASSTYRTTGSASTASSAYRTTGSASTASNAYRTTGSANTASSTYRTTGSASTASSAYRTTGSASTASNAYRTTGSANTASNTYRTTGSANTARTAAASHTSNTSASGAPFVFSVAHTFDIPKRGVAVYGTMTGSIKLGARLHINNQSMSIPVIGLERNHTLVDSIESISNTPVECILLLPSYIDKNALAGAQLIGQ